MKKILTKILLVGLLLFGSTAMADDLYYGPINDEFIYWDGKCPCCKKLGFRSRVYLGMSMSTLLYSEPYYDEDGLYHDNDPNTITTNARCSIGHDFVIIESMEGTKIKSECDGDNL